MSTICASQTEFDSIALTDIDFPFSRLHQSNGRSEIQHLSKDFSSPLIVYIGSRIHKVPNVAHGMISLVVLLKYTVLSVAHGMISLVVLLKYTVLSVAHGMISLVVLLKYTVLSVAHGMTSLVVLLKYTVLSVAHGMTSLVECYTNIQCLMWPMA